MSYMKVKSLTIKDKEKKLIAAVNNVQPLTYYETNVTEDSIESIVHWFLTGEWKAESANDYKWGYAAIKTREYLKENFKELKYHDLDELNQKEKDEVVNFFMERTKDKEEVQIYHNGSPVSLNKSTYKYKTEIIDIKKATVRVYNTCNENFKIIPVK